MSVRDDILEQARQFAGAHEHQPTPEQLVGFFVTAQCGGAPTLAEAARSLAKLTYGVYVGKIDDAHVRHWCGIFACAVLVKAGLGVRWDLKYGTGIKHMRGPSVTKLSGHTGIRPGDVAIDNAGHGHHFIITRVDSNTVDSIDGNTKGNMIRRVPGKHIATIAAYYKIGSN